MTRRNLMFISFQALLHFIYRDCLPDTVEVASGSSPSSCKVDTIMAQHLLAAADRFGLDRLRYLCEARLCKEVNVENVATTLALAEQHNAIQLKTVCLKFAASNLAGTIDLGLIWMPINYFCGLISLAMNLYFSILHQSTFKFVF